MALAGTSTSTGTSAGRSTGTVADLPQWRALQAHAREAISQHHLRDLLADERRCAALFKSVGGLCVDFSRQRATTETLRLLLELAEAADLRGKIDRMLGGEAVNATEGRAALHVATRAPRDGSATVDPGRRNVVPDVWAVLDRVRDFSERVRGGARVGATGKPLTSVLAVGIGGSFLGPLCVHTALSTEPGAAAAAAGRQLRFLANVDPVDFERAVAGLDPETTLAVVVSKTFTTAETMANARAVRAWLQARMGAGCVAAHMVAVSTDLAQVERFGIDPADAFGFWDWVGGRFSTCSAVGVLPLSLQYGFDTAARMLEGARSVDRHLASAPLADNLPVLMGLLAVWNSSFLGLPACAVLPYSQALAALPAHVQQVSMESNGKGVAADGAPLPFEAGEIVFGEPGTNGQHSFYQLLHQGRVVPCDFIGVARSQATGSGFGGDAAAGRHDELVSNMLAQADALACGRRDSTAPHRTFEGNRPSTCVLLPECTAYTVGQLLALYEHRVAVQGFVWGINPFDQWGVELGKELARTVRSAIDRARTGAPLDCSGSVTGPTERMLRAYLAMEGDTTA